MTRKMKDSGVEWIGDIPEDWEITKLKNCTNISSGGYVSKERYLPNGKYQIIGSNGCIGYTDKYNNIKKVITTGRVGTIGKINIVRESWITDNVLILKHNSNVLLEYLYYLMKNLNFNLISSGTAQPLITATDLKNQIVPINNISQQRSIADFLDKKVLEIDNIISKTKTVIEKYKQYKQSLITETVTKGLDKNVVMRDSGVEWIGDIPEHWDLRKIKYIFNIEKNIANELGYDVISITQRGLRIRDLSSNDGQLSMDYSKYQIVNINDFAMNHMDLLTGWVDLSKSLGVTSPDYRVFNIKDTNKYNNQYYLKLLQLCYTNKIFYGYGQGVSNLGRWRLQTEVFKHIYYPIPPLKEQEAIASYLDEKCTQIDNIISTKETLLIEMEKYKNSLIYETVTGKREV